jgi:hypothetical protein
MVQHPVCGNETPSDRYLIRKQNCFTIEICHFPARFGTNKHPGSSIGYSERSPQIDKPINPSASNVTEFKC